jgi:hypothetical protein
MNAANCSAFLCTLRVNTGPRTNIGLVSVEIILLLAAHGRLSTAELIEMTGASDGQISRGARQFLVWWDKKTQTVRKPELYLLQRRRKGRAYCFQLTSQGRAMLRQAGVLLTAPGV